MRKNKPDGLRRSGFLTNNERPSASAATAAPEGGREWRQIYQAPGRQPTQAPTTSSGGGGGGGGGRSGQEAALECFQLDLHDDLSRAAELRSPDDERQQLARQLDGAAAHSSTAAGDPPPRTHLMSLTSECLSHLGTQLANEGSTQASARSAPLATSFSCNDTQLSLMNIRSEELNFGDIKQVWLVKSWQEIFLRAAFVVPIVLLGLVGNSTIIYSMCRFKPIRSKPTNIFILNMALADLLTSIVCPNAALLTDIHQFYVLGAFVCRTEGFIKITCLLVSAYSLIVLSFDWFLSVVKPCRTRINIRQAWLTLVTIWMVSVMMAAPLLFSRVLRERQWKDLVEVWCRELIQYTKFYWVCITLFLIYLPTFVMTIVLVVILAQMDRFEAKLRRSRGLAPTSNARGAPTSRDTSSRTSISVMHSWSFSTSLDTNPPASRRPSDAHSGASLAAGPSVAPLGGSQHNSSLSISMKYRRRIVKILFFYLLTSIVCWTPLQFTIIYRHFRSEAVPADWFFELTFFSQLSASLSAAMNPIIFGFLSQPFRRIVVKPCMFRLLDKLMLANRRGAKTEDEARIVAGELPMNQMKPPQAAPANLSNQQRQRAAQLNHNHDLTSNRSSAGARAQQEQPVVERHANGSQFNAGRAGRRPTDAAHHHHRPRPLSSSIISNQHGKLSHHSLSVQRSNSSMTNGGRQARAGPSKRVSFKRTSSGNAAAGGRPNEGRASNGCVNGAYAAHDGPGPRRPESPEARGRTVGLAKKD